MTETLASRLAERNRQRALRAERLARLRPSADDAEAALEDFLRALTGNLPPPPAPAPEPPGAVLPFRAGRGEPASDLARLPGVGPGLIWALERAGIVSLAVLAALEPEDLAARLGPLGRLVPAEAWITAARAAAG
jgi:predicted flap endonuclease-1-like 5' DNA nuclease